MSNRYPSHRFRSELDVSERIRQIKATYGGSDRTVPFFDRPQYVRYNSIAKSFDLGSELFVDAEINGTINTKAGSNTLYFSFTSKLPARLIVFLADAGGFTVKDGLLVSLSDNQRRLLPLEESRQRLTFDALPVSTLRSQLEAITLAYQQQITTVDPYVDFDYWVQGYTQDDTSVVLEQFALFQPIIDSLTDTFSVFQAGILDPGSYRITLSSLVWREASYRLIIRSYPYVPCVGDMTGTCNSVATMTVVSP